MRCDPKYLTKLSAYFRLRELILPSRIQPAPGAPEAIQSFAEGSV
jgi:hypothetical protein